DQCGYHCRRKQRGDRARAVLDLATASTHRAGVSRGVFQPVVRHQRHSLFRAAHLRPDRPRPAGSLAPVGGNWRDQLGVHVRGIVAHRSAGAPHALDHRLDGLLAVARRLLVGVLQRARIDRAGLYLCLHRRARRGTRHRHLGADLGDFPQPLPRGRPIARQRNALGVRGPADDAVPFDGERVPPGRDLPLLLWHDGPAAHLGARDGSGDQGRAARGNPTAPRSLLMLRPVVVGAGEVLWDVFPDAEHFGGAPANAALHAAALGAEAWLVSAVGRDARGETALARLERGGVQRAAVAVLADHPTGIVRVSLDSAGQPSYAIASGSAWDHIPWSAIIAEVAERADAIF